MHRLLSRRQALLLVLLMAVTSVSFYLDRPSDTKPYRELVKYSQLIDEHETRLVQQLLYIRYGAVNQYDGLANDLSEIQNYTHQFISSVERFPWYSASVYSEELQRISSLVQEQDSVIAEFHKTHSSLMQTLNYFQTLRTNILSENAKSANNKNLPELFDKVIHQVNIFPVTQIGRNIVLIKTDINAIKQWYLHDASKLNFSEFEQQSDALLQDLRSLAKLQARLQAREVSSFVSDFIDNVVTEKKQSETSHNTFHIIGYLTSLLLIIYLAYLLFTIKKYNRTLEITNNKLISEKSKMLNTLSSLSDGVIKISPSGHVLYMNRVAEKMAGQSEGGGLGLPLRNVLDLYDAVTKNKVEDVVAECKSHSSLYERHKNYVLKTNQNQSYMVELNYVPLKNKEHDMENFVLVLHDVSENHHLIEQMLYQATHDSLTGLINRTEFERKVLESITEAKETGTKHVLVFLDIDQFKLINDSSGHLVGDELLRRIALILEQFVASTGIVCRLGGDEFGILFQNRLLPEVEVLSSELLEKIKSDRFQWKSSKFEVSASIGMVEIDPYTTDLREVMAHADIAVYTAKDLGRNRSHIFVENDVVLAKRHQELTWAASITRALDEERFRLYYQKIKSIKPDAEHLDKVEILVRLVDDNGKEISPGAFIPAAERYNMMGAIDRWVVRNALKILHELQVQHRVDTCQFSINLSGNSLSDPGFLDFIIKTLSHYPVELNSLCFEVTETAAISNLADATNLIVQLQDRGILFALDDFGSGLSSFSYLKNLSVDFLKIDGAFVKNMVNNMEDFAMVEAINQVGHVMGMQTVAEFVENDEILARLVDIGVDYAQGYGIARPEPLSNLLAILENRGNKCASGEISD